MSVFLKSGYSKATRSRMAAAGLVWRFKFKLIQMRENVKSRSRAGHVPLVLSSTGGEHFHPSSQKVRSDGAVLVGTRRQLTMALIFHFPISSRKSPPLFFFLKTLQRGILSLSASKGPGCLGRGAMSLPPLWAVTRISGSLAAPRSNPSLHPTSHDSLSPHLPAPGPHLLQYFLWAKARWIF